MSTASEKNMSLNHAIVGWIRHTENILTEKDGKNKLNRLVIIVPAGHYKAQTRSFPNSLEKKFKQKITANYCHNLLPFESKQG